MLNIVLVEPEIPQNTGNIARTCAATGCRLHLVEPLGFEISDRTLKRAGLDYWHLVEVVRYSDWNDFAARNPGRFMYMTTKAGQSYTDASFQDGDYLVFGKETKGLPEELLRADLDHCFRIPMIEDARSLNLSNAVAVVAYEALRQLGFPGLKGFGKLREG